MRRKEGALVPLEQRIMDIIGDDEMYGMEICRALNWHRKGGFGTVYRALVRMEHQLQPPRLVSRLEPAEDAELENRPRRRIYHRHPAHGEAPE